eukprot:scaffold3473_cov122-Isochrysis_galbana.AAC.2
MIRDGEGKKVSGGVPEAFRRTVVYVELGLHAVVHVGLVQHALVGPRVAGLVVLSPRAAGAAHDDHVHPGVVFGRVLAVLQCEEVAGLGGLEQSK